MWQIKWTNVSDHSRNFFYFHVKSGNYNYTKSKLFILIKSYILTPDLLVVTQNHYHAPDTQVCHKNLQESEAFRNLGLPQTSKMECFATRVND